MNWMQDRQERTKERDKSKREAGRGSGEVKMSGAAIPRIVTETPSSSVAALDSPQFIVDAKLPPKIAAHAPGARFPPYPFYNKRAA